MGVYIIPKHSIIARGLGGLKIYHSFTRAFWSRLDASSSSADSAPGTAGRKAALILNRESGGMLPPSRYTKASCSPACGQPKRGHAECPGRIRSRDGWQDQAAPSPCLQCQKKAFSGRPTSVMTACTQSLRLPACLRASRSPRRAGLPAVGCRGCSRSGAGLLRSPIVRTDKRDAFAPRSHLPSFAFARKELVTHATMRPSKKVSATARVCTTGRSENPGLPNQCVARREQAKIPASPMPFCDVG